MGVRGQYEYLNSREATDEDVLDFLEQRVVYVTDAGGAAMPVEQFWQSGDLERYWAARDVWVEDAPPRYALPDLPTLLNVVAGPVGSQRVTFLEYLTMLWEQYAGWMATEGRDPLNPSETKRQRGARRARESMALSRERRRGAVDPARAELLARDRELYDAYMAACAHRKEVMRGLDAEVAAAKALYDAVHAQLKAGGAS